MGNEKNFFEEIVKDDDVILMIDYMKETVIAVYYKRHGEIFVHFVYASGIISNKHIKGMGEVNGANLLGHLLGFNNFPLYQTWDEIGDNAKENLILIYNDVLAKTLEIRSVNSKDVPEKDDKEKTVN